MYDFSEAILFESASPVTLYYRSDFGVGHVMRVCRSVRVEVTKYAQYQRALEVSFIPKAGRREHSFFQTYEPSLVIVRGHGHGIPADKEVLKDDGRVQVSRYKYSSTDPRWQSDFDAWLAEQNVEILADYRKYDTGAR